MRNYDNSELTPAHLAEDDRVRVTYNSAYSDKRQSFEGTVTGIGGALGPVTIDPHEDMDDGEPRIYVLDSDVSVDTGYGDRRISDMTNPDIVIELLEESDEEESAEALIHAEKGDVITLTYESVHEKFGRQRRTIEVIEEPYRYDYEHESYESCELFARVLDRESAPYVVIYAYNDGEGDVFTGFEGYSDDVENIDRDTTRFGEDIRVEHIKPADSESNPALREPEVCTDGGVETNDDGYCRAETTVNGETIWCEKAPHHDGDHASHIPDEDRPGLLWDRYDWSDEEPEVCTDGGFDELLDASADANATHDATLTRDEVAALDDETPVTLAYETTQRTEKTITATVDRAWDGAYFAIAFLTTADDNERTLHVYKSGRGTLYCEHDAPAGGQRLSQLSRAYIVRPDSEPEPEPVPDGGRQDHEPRDYRDLIESEELPAPLEEGEHVDTDKGVHFERLEGVHCEEFVVGAGLTNDAVVIDREEIGLFAELAGYEVTER